MPIPRYGVWKGTPTKWNPTEKPDHGHLTFTDSSGATLDAAINVLSQTPDTRLVYWVNRCFDATHPLTALLCTLPGGFHALPHNSASARPLALDFFRSGILTVSDGVILAHDEVLDYLDPILNSAVAQAADLYIYGSEYDTLDGIHDVHMNQGDTDSVDATTGKTEDFSRDNGTYQDGGMILKFPDGHWEAVFLAFASQTCKTDDKGMPDGPLFSAVLTIGDPGGGDGGSSGGGAQDGPSGQDHGEKGSCDDAISIQAVLVNLTGPDDHLTSRDLEMVYLLNRSAAAVNLAGWTISTGTGHVETLSDSEVLGPHKRKKVIVPQAALSNGGGNITLKNASGAVVNAVSYTKDQAQQEGGLVYFHKKHHKPKHHAK